MVRLMLSSGVRGLSNVGHIGPEQAPSIGVDVWLVDASFVRGHLRVDQLGLFLSGQLLFKSFFVGEKLLLPLLLLHFPFLLLGRCLRLCLERCLTL